MIIDSHVHISLLNKKGDLKTAKKKLLAQMKKNKITRAFVIPDNVPNPQCADMNTVAKLISKEPKLSMIATYKINAIDLKNLEKLFKSKKALGFKIFPGHDPVYPHDKRWFPVYRLCQKYDLPLIIHTGINSNNTRVAKYNDPKHITKVAKKFKKLKIIIAHYFWPKLDYCYKTTAGFDNIYFDTSALADPEVIKKSGSIEKIRNVLNKTIQRNLNSVLFGTDWPIGNIKKHIDLINSLNITTKEKQKIFSQNTIKIFNLNK